MSGRVPADDYRFIHVLLDAYRTEGTSVFTPGDPRLVALEKQLHANGQYMHIADVIAMKVLYASGTCRDLFGLEPEDINMGTFFSRTHPDDIVRHNRIRTKTFSASQDVYIARRGAFVHASNVRQPDALGNYLNVLLQAYLCYSGPPNDTVVMALVLTDLSGFSLKRTGYHYYYGNDLSFFRYPDQALLSVGHTYTEREIEILQRIAKGLESERIAEELFLSVNTVNTHRRNIVKKSGKSSTHDVVIELKELGLL